MHPQYGSKIEIKKPNLKTLTSYRGLMFIAAMLLCSQGFVVEARGEKPVDFAREILPVHSDKCFVCHGPDGEAKDDLRLDSFEEATRLIDGHRASNTKNYVQDTGTKLYRRSLYVYWKRTSPHPMMTLFDAPSRETSCVRRSQRNDPALDGNRPQAFNLPLSGS